MKKYNVCVVGFGAVGREITRLLEQRDFPIDSLRLLAKSNKVEEMDGTPYSIRMTTPDSFIDMDFAFFAGTEGEKGASRMFSSHAIRSGCTVIDNGDDFRMEQDVPLVIPEINPDALNGYKPMIANPNCSTIIALMALGPLHRICKIRRIVASTYQAVSGTGSAAITELEDQTRNWAIGEKLIVNTGIYPHQIFSNVIPSVGSYKDDSGESTEEIKMRRETHKILEDDSISVATTCVRVPVFNGHSIALNVEFRSAISVAEAREALCQASGVRVVDDPTNAQFPMPIHASGGTDVIVGRIRKDTTVEHGLQLWCSGDNIWKGAAQNAIQIAEHLISR